MKQEESLEYEQMKKKALEPLRFLPRFKCLISPYKSW
jgi:hypothetical protein